MDRLTRKKLKSDEFALEIGHTVDFVSAHRTQVIRWSAVAAVVVALVAGVFLYRSHSKKARQEALATAMEIQRAPIGPSTDGFVRSYPTAPERERAAAKAFSDIAADSAGTDEGYIAEYYLGMAAAGSGKALEAEKWLKDVSDNANANYASLAKLTLADLYRGEGRVADGEKLLRGLIAKPTDFVSKDQATIALGQLLVQSNPAEARKLLESLRGERTTISQAAIGALSELGGVK